MKNKKILLLGGSGALGKTLTRRLINDNEIIVFSRSEHNHVNMKRDFPIVDIKLPSIETQLRELKAFYEK